jgi:hypothetical protein
MNTYHLSVKQFLDTVLDSRVDYIRFKSKHLIEITYKDGSASCVHFFENYTDKWFGDE